MFGYCDTCTDWVRAVGHFPFDECVQECITLVVVSIRLKLIVSAKLIIFLQYTREQLSQLLSG